MAQQVDFALAQYADGTLTVTLSPPVPVGGWEIEWVMQKHFGSESPLVRKSVASGFNGASGIRVTNSGQGEFKVTINSVDTSGLDPINYVHSARRLTSGSRVPLAEGYVILTPSVR